MTAPYDKVVDLDRLALFLNNCDSRFAPIGGAGGGNAIPMLDFDPESTSYDFTPGTYAFRVQTQSVSVDGVVQWASLLTHLQNEGMSVVGSYDGATGVLEVAKLPYGGAVQTVTVTPNNGAQGGSGTSYPVYVCTRRYVTGMVPEWGAWYTVSKPTV